MSVILFFDVLSFPHFLIVGEFEDRLPISAEHAVVLATVKDASRH
jgi:hypothetical protein